MHVETGLSVFGVASLCGAYAPTAGALIGARVLLAMGGAMIMPALLGLTLSIGTTASSIAIMGSVEAEKGGAAGSLEGTSYEMGGGLGISIFGVFLASIYSRNFVTPEGIAPEVMASASQSMGETLIAAATLPAPQGAALIAAGQAAFSNAHGVVLTSAGVMFLVLAVVVYRLLASYKPGAVSH